MNVVLPMAGRGSRFTNSGYTTPKPFIEINGKPMFLWALESIKGLSIDNLLIVVLEEHRNQYNLDNLLRENCDIPFEIICIDSVSEGQLCTVLACKSFFDSENEVLIISSDTLVISNINEIIKSSKNVDGIISTMISDYGDNWSFIKFNTKGNVIEVAEKNRISNCISTGLYYFKSGKKFLFYANELIRQNFRVNGEFYVIPVYNLMIKAGLNIKTANSLQMWDMGNPESKKIFQDALNNNLVLL
jgi:UDP-N-acetylglucosamine diphosphorylase / glucose-1-phosphate thymidylyltransferase / UDP-N-acetylgalactosamine diphosphorylase / glucosamine-1-phosphate N-acetyltransferase / galactosamine-1-phosphate N-acetyltransferase